MIRSARAERKTLTEIAEEELRHAIATGAYRAGSQLPTETELVAMLGVSRTVVREALRMLEEGGLILRRHGVGTFVRDQAILKNLNFNYGITEMIESAGLRAGTSHLAARREPADSDLSEQLRVPLGTPMLTIERVRTADERPVVFSLDSLAEAHLRGVAFDPNRLLTESVYSLLQVDGGRGIEYGIARVQPAVAPDHVAEHLALPVGAMVLYLVQTDYSAADEPVLYSREYHLPDAFDFIIWRRGPARLRSAAGPAAAE
jgi:DNA-binding GntR family transcriptional regulator